MSTAGRPTAASLSDTTIRSPRKPLSATFGLIFANLLVFFLMAWSAGHVLNFGGNQVLGWGGNYGPLTLGGQWWRLVSAMFVHIGLLHIAVNMWALYELGLLTEQIYGAPTTLVLYLLTGVAGSIASVAFNPVIVTAGASGAIFGLAGVLIATLALDRHGFRSRALKIALASLIAFAGYNLTYGFLKGGIDNGAHLGGLVCGLALGVVLGRNRAKEGAPRLGARLYLVCFALGALVLGFAAVKSTRGQAAAIESAKRDLQMGNADVAIRKLSQTRAGRNGDDYFSVLAMAYTQKQQFDVAAGYYQKALQMNPKNAAARRGLGLLLVRSGRLEDGRKQLEEAVKLDPTADAAWFELGMLWQRQGNYQESVKCLQKAAALEPSSAPTQFALGISQMNLRQYDGAIAAFQKTTQLNPADYGGFIWLGNAYGAKGETAQASAAYARAQQLRSAAAARARRR